MDNPVGSQILRTDIIGLVPGSANKAAGSPHGICQNECNCIFVGICIGNTIWSSQSRKSPYAIKLTGIGSAMEQLMPLNSLTNASQVRFEHPHTISLGNIVCAIQTANGSTYV
jgi:hypothetical protein